MKPACPAPSVTDNPCNYITVGEGLERNLLYSMIGMQLKWDTIKKSFESTYGPQTDRGQNKTLRDLLTLNSYGPGGQRASLILLKQFKQNNFSTAEAINFMNGTGNSRDIPGGHANYIRQINQTQRSLASISPNFKNCVK